MNAPNRSDPPASTTPINNQQMMTIPNYTPYPRQLMIQIPITLPSMNGFIYDAPGNNFPSSRPQNYVPHTGQMMIQIPVPLPPIPMGGFIHPGNLVNFSTPRCNVLTCPENYPPVPRPFAIQFPDPAPSANRSVASVCPEPPLQREPQPTTVIPPKSCGFCRSLGCPASVHTTHNLRNSAGVLMCRTLLNYKCRICHQTGHTEMYCQRNPRGHQKVHHN
ncbi:uncharacterized protein LOC143916993 isoform X2 [Arctopsyche grandis]|uniref:uncharacterized protein LOC143916993 isoform X2 n=1 Tax=Arctopsyche grandis TaxID=121162 RepID=UPI00406D8110